MEQYQGSKIARMVALDLDGTLFDPTQNITPRAAAAVRAAQATGIEVVIATGRRHTFAWTTIGDLHLAEDAIVLSSNGAVVRERGGRLLHRTQLPRELALEICAVVGAERERLVFTFDKVDEDPLAARHAGSLLLETSAPLRGIIQRWVDDNRADVVEVAPIENGLRHELPIQAMVCGGVAAMQALEARLAASQLGAHLSIHRTEYPARDLSIVDLLPAGTGKGPALARLAAERGFVAGQVAAVGDNYNDRDMLCWAGHGYLMGNAAQHLLDEAAELGWTVVPTNEQDGCAMALEHLVEMAAANAERNAMLAR